MTLLEASGPLGPLLPAHLSEFVVGIVLFIVIIVVMRKVIVPRFETMYSRRIDEIRGGMDRAEKAQAAAKAALEKYQGQLANVSSEAASIRDQAKADGLQIQAQLRDAAQTEANRIVDSGRNQIAAERTHALEGLRKDVGAMATALAGRIVGQTLDDDARVNQTVDNFIKSISDDTKAGAIRSSTNSSTK
ncbi:MAG: F0F1 ATP synthase subunit B [Propionibacteriaceae bacterium]|jgi:F-type H+-transporting ATPase subunit b|nr:F0F1 ATP synthase subunit B [Propionibacteriaceae bacterium]